MRLQLLVLVLIGLTLNTAHAADAKAGKSAAVICSGCHGQDGISTNPLWPNLAGQKEAYLAKQLMDFKAGDRKNPIMSAMAVVLSDRDIANIAAYFSNIK